MQTENHSPGKASAKKRKVIPLTKIQQNLAEKHRIAALKIAWNEERKLGGSNGYYAYALDINAVAEELLVVAAAKFDPGRERANFGAYLRTCIRNGLIREYRNCERYVRSNYDPWLQREMHEDGRGKGQTDILLSEKELAIEEICKKIDEICELKVRAKDVLLTISHEESLSLMAQRYGIPQHALRYEQKKVINAIRADREMSDSFRSALTETEQPEKANNCGIITKKTCEA